MRGSRHPAPTRCGLRYVALGVSLVALTGCASGLIGSPGPSAAEVENLEQRLLDAERRATVGEVEVARLKRRIRQLEAELEQAETATRRAPVREEVPKMAREPDLAPPAPQPEIEEIDLEPAPIEQPPVAPSEPEPVVTTATEAPPPTGAPTAQAQALYDEGYTHFHQQRYAEAEERFRQFVEQYPRTDLSDNAFFWIGECRYARGDYDSALEAFTATVERYPQGNKVGDALFKAGRCLEALGDLAQAKNTYEEVARRYQGTGAAAQARDRLAELR